MNPGLTKNAFLTTLIFLVALHQRTSKSDDLENSKVMGVLERLAHDGRKRPLPVGRLYQTNNKNQILELKLRDAKLKPGDLAVFAELEKLQKLDLSQSNVIDDQLRSLSGYAELSELNLYSTSITGKGLAHLRMMVQLENLDLGRTKIDDESLKTCRSMISLSRLGLRGTKVQGKGLGHIQSLKKLSCIDLGDTDLSDHGVNYLVRMPSLNSVMLDQTKVTAKGIKKLSAVPRLNWMSSAERTAREWIKRVKAKDYDSAGLMNPVGLKIPATGVYSKETMTAKKRELKDMVDHSHRFRVEFHWEVDGRKPTRLYAELAVDRGAVKIMGLGIAE